MLLENEEKIKILKKYFLNDQGIIDLSKIDFGNDTITLEGIKAHRIINNNQRAKYILNKRQKGDLITNAVQKAKVITNSHQIATNSIFNNDQETDYMSDYTQKYNKKIT